MNTIVVCFGLLAVPLVAAGEVVIACDVGSGPRMRLEVIREASIADTYVYLLRQNGKSTPVFSDIDGSRGAAVSAVCVGQKNRALIFSGEFNANAVQGFVVTYKPQNQRVGRLDFAEKSRPKWLFLSKNESIIVIPTHGLGETSKKFVAYQSQTGINAAPAGKGIDLLPRANGYEKIDLAVLTSDQK